MAQKEEVYVDLGSMEGDNTTLTIRGNGYDIDGNLHTGVTVNEGQTLNIENVGMDSEGTVTGDGWSGFGFDSTIINNGNMDITNVVFSNNSITVGNVYGGIIKNTGYINNITGQFINNAMGDVTASQTSGPKFSAGGSLIDNNGGLIRNIETVMSGNYTKYNSSYNLI